MRRSTRIIVATVATICVLLFTGCPKEEVHEHYYDSEKQEVRGDALDGSAIVTRKITREVHITYDFKEGNEGNVRRSRVKTWITILVPGTCEEAEEGGPLTRTLDTVMIDAEKRFGFTTRDWEVDEEHHTIDGKSKCFIGTLTIHHDPVPVSVEIPLDDPPPQPANETVAVSTAAE